MLINIIFQMAVNILYFGIMVWLTVYCGAYAVFSIKHQGLKSHHSYWFSYVLTFLIAGFVIATTPFNVEEGKIIYEISYGRIFFYQMLTLTSEYCAFLFLFRQVQISNKTLEKFIVLITNLFFFLIFTIVPCVVNYDRSVVISTDSFLYGMFLYMSVLAEKHTFVTTITNSFQILFYGRFLILILILLFTALVDQRNNGIDYPRQARIMADLFINKHVLFIVLSCQGILIPWWLRYATITMLIMSRIAFIIAANRTQKKTLPTGVRSVDL